MLVVQFRSLLLRLPLIVEPRIPPLDQIGRGLEISVAPMQVVNLQDGASEVSEGVDEEHEEGVVGFLFVDAHYDLSLPVDQRQLVLPVATTIFAGHMW